MARRAKKGREAERPRVVRFLRSYPIRGTIYTPGDLEEVEPRFLPRILGASPPFGELVEDLEEATAPPEEPETAPEEEGGEEADEEPAE